MPRKKKSKRKRKEVKKEIRLEGGEYIYCKRAVKNSKGKLRYNERWVPALACREHSQGKMRKRELSEYIEERCFGCTKWIQQLRERREAYVYANNSTDSK